MPSSNTDAPESFAREGFQELFGHHLVGIDIHPVEGRDHTRMRCKGLHYSVTPKGFHLAPDRLSRYSTASTANSRTSTKCPAIAAAAAITGLTKCVRLSRP